MTVDGLTLALTWAGLAAAALPALPLTLALFPRLPLSQRLVLTAALSLTLPALGELLAGLLLGLPIDRTSVLLWTGALAGAGTLLLLLRGLPTGWWKPAAGARLAVALALVGLLVLGAALTYRPHLDYQPPLHRDEWMHYNDAAAIERSGDVEAATSGGFDRHPELGFHVLLVHVHLLLGVPWEALLLAWPTFVFVLTMAALFAATAPFGYGLEAALLSLALPTTVRVLGPQLAVPLAFGLFLIPNAYLLFLQPERRRAWGALVVLTAFIYLAHPPSAAAVAFLILSYASLSLRRNPWFAAALVPIALVPLALGVVEAPQFSDPDALVVADSSLPVPTFLQLYGILPLALFLVGVYAVLARPVPERLGWFGASVAHLAIIGAFLLFHFGVTILYDRAWLHGMLTMTVTAASGLAWLRERLRPRLSSRPWAPAAFALVVAGTVLLATVPAQAEHERSYYHVLSEREFEDFQWIASNVELRNGSKAAVLPFKAAAFEAITGIPPVMISWVADPPGGMREFLDDGGRDQRYVEQRDIGIIYAPSVENPDFEQVRPSVYVRR